MTLTVTVRPGQRTEIRDLPWEGPGAGYRIIGEAIAATRSDQVQFDSGAFSVSRPHTAALISALAGRYGRVRVIHHGGVTKCVSACWTADPNTAIECECSCAGANHGSQHALGRIVSTDGPVGDLSVAPDGPREYFVTG